MTVHAEIAPPPAKRRQKQRRHKPTSRTEVRRRGRQRMSNARAEFFVKLKTLPDDAVLTFKEWCALNSISERTGRRILGSGSGPVVTALSERRVGITIRANRLWQAARERG